MTPYAFTQKHRIILTLSGGDVRHDDDKWEHVEYTATLKARGGKSITVPYKCGMACETPTASDIVLTLAMDQRSDTSSFDDFCPEFGYDSDSRKAEATFKALQAQQRKVVNWLTPDALADLEDVDES